MIYIKFLLVISFLIVFFQDLKERHVYWFLLPIIGLLSGMLFYQNTLIEIFIISLSMNLLFIALLILVIFLYSKFKLKSDFYKSIGLGDILLFLALTVSFSTVSFIVIFISALIFSLALHLILNKLQKAVTVPLAGYMSLFFLISYVFHWAGYIHVYNI